MPPGFRFSVKAPQAITHDVDLAAPAARLDGFLGEIGMLGERLGPILLQLPPKRAFDVRSAGRWLALLRERFDGDVCIEPRHPSWFTRAADRLLVRHRVARVAADPSRATGGDEPGGFEGFVYHRLHGSPQVYRSSYSGEALAALAGRIVSTLGRGVPTWCIFDNTTLGAATTNALDLLALVQARVTPGRDGACAKDRACG